MAKDSVPAAWSWAVAGLAGIITSAALCIKIAKREKGTMKQHVRRGRAYRQLTATGTIQPTTQTMFQAKFLAWCVA